MSLGCAVQQQQRRPLPTDDTIDLCSGAVDFERPEPWKEARGVGASLRLSAETCRNGARDERRHAPEYVTSIEGACALFARETL